MSDDANDPFASPPSGRDAHHTPPPLNGPGLPPPESGPFVTKPKKYRGGLVFLTIVIAMVLSVVIIAAMANLGASDGNLLWIVVGAVIVTGVVLVRSDTPGKRSVGLGLLWFLPVALIALPAIGLVICLVAASSSGY